MIELAMDLVLETGVDIPVAKVEDGGAKMMARAQALKKMLEVLRKLAGRDVHPEWGRSRRLQRLGATRSVHIVCLKGRPGMSTRTEGALRKLQEEVARVRVEGWRRQRRPNRGQGASRGGGLETSV
eukprot:TRINITY_DN9463_c0_g1_i1.p1 TRINITY_DN9463_c0_g1~~TRINITY_DN9463_c0_g1_i1.p1  ORF type:complete len:126 (-),score=25.38 TRINITY_DN9463_c0_g1_i1:86-463(-)